MRRLARYSPLFLALALPACGDESVGTPSTPGVSDVTPLKVYLARTTDVVVSGSETTWSPAATVDFGAGVKVEKVTVASTAALVANVTVDKAAELGVRDVKVTDGSSVTTFKGAFAVDAPIAVDAIEGTVAQGSLSIVHVRNKDLTTPFDITTDANGDFVNLKLDGIAGASALFNSASIVSVDFILLVDVTATTGDQVLNLKSGPTDRAIDNPVPKGLSITARAPATLGTAPLGGNVANAYESYLYQLTPAAKLQLVDMVLTPSKAPTDASPRAFILPKSGKFSELLGSVSSSAPRVLVTKSADPFYFVFWDNTGSKGYSYTLRSSAMDATLVTKTGSPSTLTGAQAISTLPAVLAPITTSSSAEYYFKVTVEKGKKIHVGTYGMAPDSDPLTLMDVDVLDDKGTSILADGPGGEVLSDPVTTAGTYYVYIAPSAGSFFSAGFDPKHNKFEAFMRLE